MTKKTAWKWCSKYIKLRDAIENYSITHDLELVLCRTCGKWIRTNSREAQAGHFIGRGIGGNSGIKWDERNIHIQCYQCNCFMQGNASEYRKFMLETYIQKVIDELEWKHRINSYKGKIPAIGEMYKQLYEELLAKTKGNPL
jgi:hypothetical protein